MECVNENWKLISGKMMITYVDEIFGAPCSMRLRGGNDEQPKPPSKNVSVNLKIASKQGKLRLPRDYNEFLDDVISRVQDLGEEGFVHPARPRVRTSTYNVRDRDGQEHPAMNISLNVVGPDRRVHDVSFDPMPLANVFYTPECVNQQSAGDYLNERIETDQPQPLCFMPGMTAPMPFNVLSNMFPPIANIVKQVWELPFGRWFRAFGGLAATRGAPLPEGAVGGENICNPALAEFMDNQQRYKNTGSGVPWGMDWTGNDELEGAAGCDNPNYLTPGQMVEDQRLNEFRDNQRRYRNTGSGVPWQMDWGDVTDDEYCE